MNVSREDVLYAALHQLEGFQRPEESDQVAAQRLVRLLEVTRSGSAYQFSILARSSDPSMAAQIANAITASYIESASRRNAVEDVLILHVRKGLVEDVGDHVVACLGGGLPREIKQAVHNRSAALGLGLDRFRTLARPFGIKRLARQGPLRPGADNGKGISKFVSNARKHGAHGWHFGAK